VTNVDSRPDPVPWRPDGQALPGAYGFIAKSDHPAQSGGGSCFEQEIDVDIFERIEHLHASA